MAFNPHVWGLFLQDARTKLDEILDIVFQSPCLGTLFARMMIVAIRTLSYLLSIPMSGDSFCKFEK